MYFSRHVKLVVNNTSTLLTSTHTQLTLRGCYSDAVSRQVLPPDVTGHGSSSMSRTWLNLMTLYTFVHLQHQLLLNTRSV